MPIDPNFEDFEHTRNNALQLLKAKLSVNLLKNEDYIDLQLDDTTLYINNGKVEDEHLEHIFAFLKHYNEKIARPKFRSNIYKITIANGVKIDSNTQLSLIKHLNKSSITSLHCDILEEEVFEEKHNELIEAYISLFEKKDMLEFVSHTNDTNYKVLKDIRVVDAILNNYNILSFTIKNNKLSENQPNITELDDLTDYKIEQHLQKNHQDAKEVLRYILNFKHLTLEHQTRLKIDLAVRLIAVEHLAKRDQETYKHYQNNKKLLGLEDVSPQDVALYKKNHQQIYVAKEDEMRREAAKNAIKDYFEESKNSLRVSGDSVYVLLSKKGMIYAGVASALSMTGGVVTYKLLPKFFAVLKENKLFLSLATFGATLSAVGVFVSGFFALHKIAYSKEERRIINDIKKNNPEILKTCKESDLKNQLHIYECNR